MNRFIFNSLLSMAAITAMASASEDVASAKSAELGTMEIVDTQEKFRNRTQSVEPELVYDREFFERFEPTTAGDMLKRVPGVVFKGDVGEYDFPSFRGLASQYTQILVNGKRVPGFEPDGSINLDRIPAEMIERIEIVRSPSAEIDSQGMAGTINIILKDGANLPEGGTFRVGVSRHSNGEDNPWTDTKYKPNLFASYSDHTDNVSYTLSAYYQQRYNAKDKVTNAYEDGFYDADSWIETEDEWDNRDSKDLSLYAKVNVDLSDDDRLMIVANYFKTDREEEQYEFKHERDAATDPFELDKVEHQIMDIDQKSYNADVEWSHMFESADELTVSFTFDKFDGTLEETEAKDGSDWTAIRNIKAVDHDAELTETDDTEFKAAATYKFADIGSHAVKLGLQAQTKTRDTSFVTYEVEDGVASERDTESLGTHEIEETRIDLFAEDTWRISDRSTLQVGGRLETTSVDQTGTEGKADNSYTFFNPSLHYKFAFNEQDQLRLSLAQTVRRPHFDDMVPFEIEEEPGEFDLLVGNPDLEAESSIGVDLGYEHAFSEQFGVIGANVFYRDVSDKIEVARIGDYTELDPSGGVYKPMNIGDGNVYGFEFDSSFPLSFLGAPSVSFFANYTYLDSNIDDPFTGEERRFNDQPDYVFNFGLTNTHRNLGLSYGFSYQQRGDSTYEDAVTTEVTSYDPNLEAYIEYRLANDMVLRLTGDNLLDADVTEEIKEFESLDDKKAGNVDKYETQIERAGAVFMITLSGRF